MDCFGGIRFSQQRRVHAPGGSVRHGQLGGWDVFTFNDILKTDAELAVAYNRMNDFSSLDVPLVQLECLARSSKNYPASFDGIRRGVQKGVWLYRSRFRDLIDASSRQAITVTSRSHLERWPSYLGIEQPSAGGRHLVGPALNQLDAQKCRYVPRSVADFAGVFILSDLVRYRPQFWVDVVRGDPRGNIGLVSLYVTSCRRRFAHDMLDALYGETFSFGTVAMLG